MTTRASVNQGRAIYEDDLQVRIDAAMSRTQRFINSAEPIRATVRTQGGRPFTPACLSCEQKGRSHKFPPTLEQHYICAHCHRRWVAQPFAS
jgi:transposase-like protein